MTWAQEATSALDTATEQGIMASLSVRLTCRQSGLAYCCPYSSKPVWAASVAYRTTYLSKCHALVLANGSLVRTSCWQQALAPKQLSSTYSRCHKASPCFPAHGLYRAKHKNHAAACGQHLIAHGKAVLQII